MVARLTLNQLIGVRIPVPQHLSSPLRKHFLVYIFYDINEFILVF